MSTVVGQETGQAPTAAPDEIGRFRVRETRDWTWDKAFNVQLAPAVLREHDSLTTGKYVLVENPHRGSRPAVFGKIDAGKHLQSDEVGIGFDLRHALGVPVGDPDRNEVALRLRQPDKKPAHRRLFDRIFRFRPIVCRVRYAVHPDIGFKTCRLPEETFDVLGIEPGDRAFLQSARDRTTVKALPVRAGTAARKETQLAENPDRYPDCQHRLDIPAIAGTSVDIPPIYLDREQRMKAGVPEDEPCHPLIVYRDSRAFFLRKLNDVTIPILAALLGFMVIFEGVLGLRYLVVALAIAVALILFSVYYQTRYESLD